MNRSIMRRKPLKVNTECFEKKNIYLNLISVMLNILDSTPILILN